MLLLLLPTFTVGVPEAEPILPTSASEPAVRLKPASSSVPVTVRLPVVISVAATSVTVWVEAITTLFPATGTTPPTQVVVTFQLPV